VVRPVGRHRFLQSAAPSPTPIRGGYSVNAIQFLKQEHQKAKAAFDKVLQASPQQRGGLWQELAPELKLHEEIEDTCLYEPLARDAASKDKELAQWRQQHQAEVEKVGGLLETIRQLRSEESAWLGKVKEVHGALEHHIQEEEGTIFPKIGKVWDESRLERAGTQMAEMKSKHMGRVA
jgi:iron-sulfur cluster repair protein YtfE (RIC family)